MAPGLLQLGGRVLVVRAHVHDGLKAATGFLPFLEPEGAESTGIELFQPLLQLLISFGRQLRYVRWRRLHGLRFGRLEDDPLWGPHEEDWCTPLHRPGLSQADSPAPFGHGGVNRITARQERVEFLREGDGPMVRDGELHGHHRRDAGHDHAGGDARKRIQALLLGNFGCLAGVQEDQAHGGCVAQENTQRTSVHHGPLPIFVLHDQHTLAGALVKVAMSHVVQHVIGQVCQPILQRQDGGLLHELHLDALLSGPTGFN